MAAVGQIERAHIDVGTALLQLHHQLLGGHTTRLERFVSGFTQGQITRLVTQQHVYLGALLLHRITEHHRHTLSLQ